MLRVGIIGAGGIASSAHFGSWGLLRHRAEIVSVADIRPDVAEDLAHRYGDVPVYTEWRQMLEDERLDAVDICLPYDKHPEVTIAALDAGLHVLCEKPMADDWHDAVKVACAAAMSDRVLMYAHCEDFHPGVFALKRLVDNGSLGHIIHVISRYCYRHHLNDAQLPVDGSNPLNWRTSEGLDYGIHGVYPIHWLNPSPPKKVFGRTKNDALPFLEDDTLQFSAELQDGMWVDVFTSYAYRLPGHPRMTVIGTEGEAWLYDTDDGAEVHYKSFAPGTVEEQRLLRYRGQQKYDAQAAHFLDCVELGHQPRATLEQAMWALQLIKAAEESERSGQVVQFRQAFELSLGRV